MKRLLVLPIFILSALTLILHCNSSGSSSGMPDQPWSKRLGGTDSDNAGSVKTDSNGNIYITGSGIGNADLNGDGDSLDGEAESVQGYGMKDIYIVKFNSSGVYQWSKRLGGVNDDSAFDMAIDSGGNVYITGNVTGDADMNGDRDSTDGGAESGAA